MRLPGWGSPSGSFATGSRSCRARRIPRPRRPRRLLEVATREDGDCEQQEDRRVNDAVCRRGRRRTWWHGESVRGLRLQVEELQIGKHAIGGERDGAGRAALRALRERLQATDQVADEEKREREGRGED